MAPAPIGPTELRDDALLLRPWAPGDVPEVERACQDPDIQRWTLVPAPYSRADAEAFVGGSAGRWADGMPSFAAVDAGSGELLGSFGVVGVSDEGDTEIGYWVAPWARRRGVATRGMRMLSRWLLESVGSPRLVWHAVVGNVASRRAAEAAGYIVEGTARLGMVHRGERVDAWTASLLPADLAGLDAGAARRPSRPVGWPDAPIVLRGARLLLRPYRLEDASGMLEYSRDPEAGLWDPEGIADLQEAEQRVRRRTDWSAGRGATWAVADPEDTALWGGVSLHEIDVEESCADIGYGLLPVARGRGLAAEAVLLVTDWAFGTLGLHRTGLRHAVGNAVSCRVAERAGFRLEGVMRESHRFGDGRLHDEHLHARLATDPRP